MSYAIGNHVDIGAVGTSGVLTAARELARGMRAICFTESGHDGIPMPAAGVSLQRRRLPRARPAGRDDRRRGRHER
ncbi:hypothetical protein [Ferrovibrio sp.]|uniref:hypothetical protein n=1 Tax=Ferrovibrio sp. TaxID=1917215 RepID=UPI00311EF963